MTKADFCLKQSADKFQVGEDIVKCPHCDNEMEYRDDGCWDYPFSFGDEPDYQVYFPKEIYICKRCNIRNENGEWNIPKHYCRPTAKQIKAILFINHYLQTHYEPLLKSQCWRIINENLKTAIEHRETYREQIAEWHREDYGEWDYY